MATFSLFLLVLSLGVFAQKDLSDDDLSKLWELAKCNPGELFWEPLLRIRAVESDFLKYRHWDVRRDSYLQQRAQKEAFMGNHAAALHFWDIRGTALNSVGFLPSGVHPVDALEYIAKIADTAGVIMVNERHHAASDRLLTLRLLSILHEKGYTYFAAETFGYDDSTLNEREYPVEKTGWYTTEPVFAEVVREALRLGYTMVPYEQTLEQKESESDLNPQQCRDYSQAQNLYRNIFRKDKNAKVLIHAGFAHIIENVSGGWYPMAMYFREITGIDPITVDQTKLSERSAPAYEQPAYRAAISEGLLDKEPIVLLDTSGHPYLPSSHKVDIQVFTPRTIYSHGRPDWMALDNRRHEVDIEVPECRDQRCFVEARAFDEPPEAIPLDRSEVNKTDTVRLFLPPGVPVNIYVHNEEGKLLREMKYIADTYHNDE